MAARERARERPAAPARTGGRAEPDHAPVERESDRLPATVEALLRRSRGRELEPEVRGWMEPRFGHDFSRVRVHTDRDAAEAARALDADAFTRGEHVYFAHGLYRPSTHAGRRLLAHELTHTLQQPPDAARPAVQRRSASGIATGLLETEAETAARRVAAGERVPPGSVSVAARHLRRPPSTGRPWPREATGGVAAEAAVRTLAAEVYRILAADPADRAGQARRRLESATPATREAVLSAVRARLNPAERTRMAEALTALATGEAVKPAVPAPVESKPAVGDGAAAVAGAPAVGASTSAEATSSMAATSPAAATPAGTRTANPSAVTARAAATVAPPAPAPAPLSGGLLAALGRLFGIGRQTGPEAPATTPEAPPQPAAPAPAPAEVATRAEAEPDAAAEAAAEQAPPVEAAATAQAAAEPRPAAEGEAGAEGGGAASQAAAAGAVPAAGGGDGGAAADTGPTDQVEGYFAEKDQAEAAQEAEAAREEETSAAAAAGPAPGSEVGLAPDAAAAVPDTVDEAASAESQVEQARQAVSQARAAEPPEAAAPAASEPMPAPDPALSPEPATPAESEMEAASEAAAAEEPELAPAPEIGGGGGDAGGAAAAPEVEAPEVEAAPMEAAPAEVPAAADLAGGASDAAGPAVDAGGDGGAATEDPEVTAMLSSGEGDAEYSGGGGGGGSALPEPTTPEVPDLSGASPEEAMSQAAALPPAQMQAALDGVTAAASRTVGEQRDALAASPPEMEAPTGAPSAAEMAAESAADERRASAAPARVERAPAGENVPIAAPDPLPPAPESPTARVSAPQVGRGEGGELSEQDVRDLRSSIRTLPTTDPALHAQVGPAPQLVLEGNADPARAQEQRAELNRSVAAAHTEGLADVARPAGENTIFPRVPTGTLTAAIPSGGGGAAPAGGASASAGGGGGGAAAVDDAAIGIIAQEERGDAVRAAARGAQGEMAAARSDHQAQTEEAHASAQAEIDAAVRESAGQQRGVRTEARAEVREQRRQWSDAQQEAVDEAHTQADAAGQEGARTIGEAARRGRQEAAQQVAEGNRRVATAREEAEGKAEREQRRGEQEGSGFFGWLASRATSFFNSIKAGIQRAFDAARRAVADAISAAQRWAAEKIEQARQAIVAGIRWVGDRLLQVGDVLLSRFPTLRDRYRSAIESGVSWAEDRVNELAEGLQAGVKALLDGLGTALNGLLNLLEAGLKAAVDSVAAAVQSAIQFARSVADGLAQFAALVRDVASDPGGWLRNLGAAVVDGVRNHLWTALKAAVREWFNSKVEQVVGLGTAVWGMLTQGGIGLAAIGKMVWGGLKAAIPPALIAILVEKLVAMIVPAAGAIMAIVEGAMAAWGAVSRIIAAFSAFFAFLRAVRGGSAGPLFATAVAAGAVAVIDFAANFLIARLRRPAGALAGRIRALAQRIGARLKKLLGRRRRGGGRRAGAGRRRGGPEARRGPDGRRRPGERRRRGGRRHPAGRRPGRRRGAAAQRRQRRDQRGRDGQRRRQEDKMQRLRRIVSALQPEVQALFRRHPTGVFVRARLLYWRVRHRLTSLTVERQGGSRVRVIARLNPWLPTGEGFMPTGEDLRELIHDAAEALVNRPDVIAMAEQMEAARERREDVAVEGGLGWAAAVRQVRSRPLPPKDRAKWGWLVGRRKTRVEEQRVDMPARTRKAENKRLAAEGKPLLPELDERDAATRSDRYNMYVQKVGRYSRPERVKATKKKPANAGGPDAAKADAPAAAGAAPAPPAPVTAPAAVAADTAAPAKKGGGGKGKGKKAAAAAPQGDPAAPAAAAPAKDGKKPRKPRRTAPKPPKPAKGSADDPELIPNEIRAIRKAMGVRDSQFANLMRQFVRTGKLPPEHAAHEKRMAHLVFLMFGRESMRNQGNLAFAAMTTELIAERKMGWDEATRGHEGIHATPEEAARRRTELKADERRRENLLRKQRGEDPLPEKPDPAPAAAAPAAAETGEEAPPAPAKPGKKGGKGGGKGAKAPAAGAAVAEAADKVPGLVPAPGTGQPGWGGTFPMSMQGAQKGASDLAEEREQVRAARAAEEAPPKIQRDVDARELARREIQLSERWLRMQMQATGTYGFAGREDALEFIIDRLLHFYRAQLAKPD